MKKRERRGRPPSAGVRSGPAIHVCNYLSGEERG
jgi:hypothetical protein